MNKERSKERSKKESRKREEEEAFLFPPPPPSSTAAAGDEARPGTTKTERRVDVAAFLRFFGAARVQCASALPPVEALSPVQQRALQRLYGRYGYERVRDAVLKFCRSAFINGRRGTTRRRFTLFWLLSEDNFLKTLGGAYDDPTPSPAQLAEAERREAARKLAETNQRLYEQEKLRESQARERAAQHAISYQEWVRQNGGNTILLPGGVPLKT